MADDAVIKLRLDLEAAKKELKDLRKEFKGIQTDAQRSGAAGAGGAGGAAAAVRRGSFVGSAAGTAAGALSAQAISQGLVLLRQIAETLLPNTITAIEKLEPSQQAFQAATQVAEQAARLGIKAPQGALEQLFRTERAAGERALTARARLRETTGFARAGDIGGVVPAVGIGVAKDIGFLTETALKALSASGTKR